MNKNKKINKFLIFKDKFVNFFRPNFVDINGQKVTKKFPWLVIVNWVVGSILIILLFKKINPDFKNSYKLFHELHLFFRVGNAEIGDLGSVTPSETFVDSLSLLWTTIVYSVIGTIFGIILSIPLALFSSKNFIKTPFVYVPTRIFMSIIRAIPPIIFPFLFFQLVSPDLSASISIGIFVASLMTKWLYEDLDTYDVSTYLGMLSIGNTKFQAFRKSILPYLIRRIVTYGLYSFEMVVRFAAILEVVGIQTIGTLLNDDYATPNNWSHMSIVLWVLVAFMIIIELSNWAIKKYILDFKPKHSIINPNDPYDIQVKKLRKQKPKIAYVKGTLVIFILLLTIIVLTQIEWGIANKIKIRQFGLGIKKLFNPKWELYENWNSGSHPIKLGLEAIMVAIASSIIGLVLALFFGIVASKKITGWFSAPFKLVIIVIRAIPPFTLALLFLLMKGDSLLFVGVLALGIHSIGMLGKLITESVDRIDDDVFISLDSVGANWYHKIKYVVIKEIMPITLSNFLYRIEINFKSTVVIGAVGASDFGLEIITSSSNSDNWDRLSAFLVFTIIVLLALEQVSNMIRKKLMKGYFLEQNSWIKRLIFKTKMLTSLSICTSKNIVFDNNYKAADYNIAKYKYDNLIYLNSSIKNVDSYEYKKEVKQTKLNVKKLNKQYKLELKNMQSNVFNKFLEKKSNSIV
ncbi:ABC transporter permease [Mycoplasma sp. Mirounga ES2805-ORL]|uniref:PhnE/PtxC family ABC transporter permease n=1 Tax=Mycoplasma sp. Mirounga ES2805-ORL TaxID=754514 RepID=UPI00197C7F3D|nr:ABC transporter permease subunit [Mycoplasma sp. Mirounga ES2805-ORL]QSF13865.1 ABC transporter permease [Mycoplasma sp. Mirounga ES2805-ORL]